MGQQDGMIGVPLYAPTVPTMLLQCVPRERRGAVMGLDNLINTLARAAAPPLLGALFAARGAGVAFGVGATVCALAAIVTAVRRWVVLRDSFA